ncbi:antA/AntB antirepressor family protein [Arsenophonus nasoniae]|uniref:AntA/AntB antirepressor n=1 Tax=Arsenophonus nasoniae TaxID=638 RepID=A0A4P7KRK7_9GAMM|nr:AntA/AntB antirepressor [Arsenophonus nasoniae]
MSNLINIETKNINGGLIQTVNARDLHAFLGVKNHFKDWIKDRIEKYGVNDHRKLIHFLSKSDQSKLIHCFTQLLLLSAAYLSIGSFHRLIAVHANDEVNDQA